MWALRAASAHIGACVLATKASKPVSIINTSSCLETSLISGILVEHCDVVEMTPESTLGGQASNISEQNISCHVLWVQQFNQIWFDLIKEWQMELKLGKLMDWCLYHHVGAVPDWQSQVPTIKHNQSLITVSTLPPLVVCLVAYCDDVTAGFSPIQSAVLDLSCLNPLPWEDMSHRLYSLHNSTKWI